MIFTSLFLFFAYSVYIAKTRYEENDICIYYRLGPGEVSIMMVLCSRYELHLTPDYNRPLLCGLNPFPYSSRKGEESKRGFNFFQYNKGEDYHMRLCITPISRKTMGFFSVPRLSGWSFQQLIHGGVLPPPHCPDTLGPAVSPTDKLRKDSTLPPVTSKKSIVFLRLKKLSGFAKLHI